jgi:AcrR family transcriptional regulator
MKRRKATRRNRRIDKRDEILVTATDYFLRHGYAGASINEMARESGISKESIYRYFRSKKKLFEAVIDHELEGYHQRIKAITHNGAGTLRAQLIVVAKTILEVVTTNRTLAMRRLIFQQATHNKDVGRHYWVIGPNYAYRQLASLFTNHARRAGIKPDLLSRYFVSMVLHFPLLQRECAVRPPIKRTQIGELATRAVDDFLRAFL